MRTNKHPVSARQRPPQRQYIIYKRIMATSAGEALRNESKASVFEVSESQNQPLSKEEQLEQQELFQLTPAFGFVMDPEPDYYDEESWI